MEIREVSEEQETQESPQIGEMVTRGLALSTRKTGTKENDRTGSRLSGRKRAAFGDVGEVDHLSGTWMGSGMIEGRLMGVDHGSDSGGVSKRGVHWPREGTDVEERRWTAKRV